MNWYVFFVFPDTFKNPNTGTKIQTKAGKKFQAQNQVAMGKEVTNIWLAEKKLSRQLPPVHTYR